MSLKLRDFAEASKKSVDDWLPAGSWPVYRHYEVVEVGDSEDSLTYVHAPPPPLDLVKHPARGDSPAYESWAWSEQDWGLRESPFFPLRVPGLFLEFATLLEDGPITAEVVKDWCERYGTLGVVEVHPDGSDGCSTDVPHRWQSVLGFYRLANEANRVLRLWEAATVPAGPDEETLRRYGAEGRTPKQLEQDARLKAIDIVKTRIKAETHGELYLRKDGQPIKGSGFWSLLGALYLQMEDLVAAPPENVRRCLWCNRIIDVRESEPPPAEAPKGVRGKHRTHSNRRFCEKTNGVANFCKNRFHYAQRKVAKVAPGRRR